MSNPDRIVSSEDENLILVDADDVPAGAMSKALCHDGDGLLHRAFSVFLFNADGELLLQQRAASKRLWPGFWSNSCCSHPRVGESMRVATERRILDELNVAVPLQFVYKFQYHADFGGRGSERELCHVYLGHLSEVVRPNTHEIDAICFVSAEKLDRDLVGHPEIYTPWLKMEWQALRFEHVDALSRYIGF